MKDRLLVWLDHRTGIETAVRNFLYERIPASSGWHQVLGSVALFLFLVQTFTGALLAFNYAPTPGDAYNSLRYILAEVTGGRLMRGLHHWGASMMIVVVVLHMIQVFLYGAYKKPREATWMAGVVLLLLTLAYGLTGYLLPWDNRAYWGTVVTTLAFTDCTCYCCHPPLHCSSLCTCTWCGNMASRRRLTMNCGRRKSFSPSRRSATRWRSSLRLRFCS
jgi:quinol-cytochrome oxidoreductase complex cytochrome b subunit